MNATRAQLVEMQQAIADGRAPTPKSDGEFYWHPKFRLGLRLYNSGRGIWLVRYRNERGQERTHKIGSAAVLNVTFAENAAKKVLGKVALGDDPQEGRQAQRDKTMRTLGTLCELYLSEVVDSPKFSRHSLRHQRSVISNHLGALGRVQADDLCQRQNDIVDLITRVSKSVSPWIARQLRSTLTSVYAFALQRFPDDYKVNPVVGTWKPSGAPARP
jgi:hypothetical protein